MVSIPGDCLEPERVRELGDRSDDRVAVPVGVALEVGDEAAVDLEEVDGEALEVGERRVARAEVVHADVGPEGLDSAEFDCGRVAGAQQRIR